MLALDVLFEFENVGLTRRLLFASVNRDFGETETDAGLCSAPAGDQLDTAISVDVDHGWVDDTTLRDGGSELVQDVFTHLWSVLTHTVGGDNDGGDRDGKGAGCVGGGHGKERADFTRSASVGCGFFSGIAADGELLPLQHVLLSSREDGLLLVRGQIACR